MPKIASLETISNIGGNPVAAEGALNENFESITAAFQNTLSRDGSTPNEMEAQLDMNSNRIINMADGVNPQDGITLSQLEGFLTSGALDGDKGDITVSGGASVFSIDAGVVGTTELGGDITVAGKALLDDASAADQRSTLGLGSAATHDHAEYALAGHGHTAVQISDFTESVQAVVAAYLVEGTGIDFTIAAFPPGTLTINATGGGGGGGTVDSVVAGTGIDVDATDPANPIVSIDFTPAPDLSAEPFVTFSASGNLSAERVLTAGTNITLDTSVAGLITVNASGGGVTDHGALTGLGDDDHPQYPLAAGTEAITGLWTFEQNPIISNDTVAALTLIDENGATDEKALHIRQNGGQLSFWLSDDDTPTSTTGAGEALRISRSGVTPQNIVMPNDNQELRLGAGGDDLAIYHDGADNYIDANTGDLFIRADGVLVAQFGGTSANPLRVTGADASGSCFISFYESQAFTTRKGFMGWSNAADDDLRFVQEEAADMEFTVNGVNFLKFVDGGGWEVTGSAGTSGQVLTSNGSASRPSWQTPASGTVTTKYGTSTPTRTTTTLSADSDMNVTLSANTDYRVSYFLVFETTAAADLKWAMSFSGTTTSAFVLGRNDNSTTTDVDDNGAIVDGTGSWISTVLDGTRVHTISGTDTMALEVHVNIRVGASGGTLSFTWAQNTASGTSTRRRDVSVVVYEAT